MVAVGVIDANGGDCRATLGVPVLKATGTGASVVFGLVRAGPLALGVGGISYF